MGLSVIIPFEGKEVAVTVRSLSLFGAVNGDDGALIAYSGGIINAITTLSNDQRRQR